MDLLASCAGLSGAGCWLVCGGQRCLDADVPAVRVAQQHLGRSPVHVGERLLDGASAGRLEAIHVAGPDERLDLGMLAAGMLEPAGVAAGLEFHLVAQRLPERDGLAPVAGLDDDPFDSACPHVFSLVPRSLQVLPQGGRGDRRERLLGVDRAVFDLADEIRRQVHLELPNVVSHNVIVLWYYSTMIRGLEIWSARPCCGACPPHTAVAWWPPNWLICAILASHHPSDVVANPSAFHASSPRSDRASRSRTVAGSTPSACRSSAAGSGRLSGRRARRKCLVSMCPLLNGRASLMARFTTARAPEV